MAIVGVVVLVAAGLLMLLNTPIASPSQGVLPVPGSGFYRLGEPTTGLSIGQQAPELEGSRDGGAVPLLDLGGDVVRLADLRGSPVWLSFFATWCPPCQEETPVLRDAYERYAPEGLQMIAVSVQETTATDVAAYAETYALLYTIGFDATSAVFRAYQGFGLPTHVFLDADGVIRHIALGPQSLAQIEAILEPLLQGSGVLASPAEPASSSAPAS